MREKSVGHIKFENGYEYLVVGDAVCKAPISNVIELGINRRSARFECSVAAWGG